MSSRFVIVVFLWIVIEQCKDYLMHRWLVIIYLSVILAWAFLRLENMTVTQGERVQFRCQLPRNFSRRENILQWKKLRASDDDLIISINGKVPKTLEKFYQTDLNDQWSSLEFFHVNREDSTTYLCQTFETQTILCHYNLVVLSKFKSRRDELMRGNDSKRHWR